MAEADKITFRNQAIKADIESAESGIENHAYWLGGTDTTRETLSQYDLQRAGYGRLFIMRMPRFMDVILPDSTKKVKHLLQYANVGVDGIQGYSVDFASVTAGYAGNTVEIPTSAKDDTTSITIKIYDTAHSLIRSYIDYWITGTIDPYTGLCHYHGACESGLDSHVIRSQANQTMEAVYVSTDPSGEQVQYACLLTNMFPKSSDHSAFVYEPGSHDLIQLSLEFTANKYMSAQIDQLGKQLLDNYKILKNYMNFASPYTVTAGSSAILAPNSGTNDSPYYQVDGGTAAGQDVNNTMAKTVHGSDVGGIGDGIWSEEAVQSYYGKGDLEQSTFKKQS